MNMTIPVTDQGPGTQEGLGNLLAFAQGLFLEAAENLAAAIAQVQSEPAAMPKAASVAARDLTAAFHTVMAERTRIDGIRTKIDSVAGNETLDLDAARSQIGSRLARLRVTAGG